MKLIKSKHSHKQKQRNSEFDARVVQKKKSMQEYKEEDIHAEAWVQKF